MEKQHRILLMLVSLCVAEAIIFINTTAFNLALPSVAGSLHASTAAQQWMVSIYSLCFLAILLVSGFFGDLIGYRRVLLSGLVLYAVAAVLGSVAHTIILVIVARGLLGLAAGMFIPMGLATITSVVSPGDNSKAVTLWTVAGTLGIPLGPIIGGLMTLLMGWRGLFVFDAVAIVIALVLNYLFMPRQHQSHIQNNQNRQNHQLKNSKISTRFPIIQATLMVVAMSALSVGLINAQTSFLSFTTLFPLCCGILFAVSFSFLTLHAKHQLTDLTLMRFTSFQVSSIALLLLNFVVFGISFILPTYFQEAKGHNALMSGIMLMPMILSAIVGALLSRNIIGRFGEKTACFINLACIGFGLAVMALAIHLDLYILLSLGQIIAGIGMGAGQPIAFSWAFVDVPVERMGKGSSLLTVFQQLGSILGIGIFGSVQGALYFQELTRELNNTRLTAAHTITISLQQAGKVSGASGKLLKVSAIKAYETAGSINFVISALVIFVILLILIVLLHACSVKKSIP